MKNIRELSGDRWTACVEDDPIDATSRHHRAIGRDVRIVSLVPSITELLFDLGLGASVVGRTVFCVHPEGQVQRVKSIGGTKQINWSKLRNLSPTHVIVNMDETPRQLADDLAAEGFAVVVTHPIEVGDNLNLFRMLGDLFGCSDKAEGLCFRFEAAYKKIINRVSRLPKQRVLYLIWKEPWMTVSRETYISRMLSLVNWQTMPMVGESRYPSIVFNEELLSSVELVLFSTEPFPFEKIHLEAFREMHPGHGDKAMLIDGQMVSWYGSRAIAGLGYLEDMAFGVLEMHPQ